MEQDEMGWIGMEWNMIGWDGMGQNKMEWNRIEQNAMRQIKTQKKIGWEGLEWDEIEKIGNKHLYHIVLRDCRPTFKLALHLNFICSIHNITLTISSDNG